MPIPTSQTPEPIPTTSAPGVRRSSPTAAPGAGSGTSGVLALVPNHRFICAHHPDNWDLETAGLDGPTWLPEIQEIPVQPGVGGARTVKQGGDDNMAYDLLVQNLKRNGYQVIMDPRYFAVPPGEPESEYLRAYRCKSPQNGAVGTYYTTVWDVPRHVRNGKRQKFARDRAAWNKWRLELVEAGILTPPHEDVVDYKRGRVATHRDRHQSETRLEERTKDAIVGSLTERLEQMENASIPAAGDSEIKRRLQKMRKADLLALAGETPLTKGKTNAQLVDMLVAAGLTVADLPEGCV